MRYKKRYFLVELDGVDNADEFEKEMYSALNKMEPFLAIRSNFRIVKELTSPKDSRTRGVIAVNDEYKYRVVFFLSLISKFYKSNLLTIMNSGNIKKIKSFKF
ncbi:MAG: hypothetical protein M1284_03395 [Candidatus Parvarchaeota archaeon]|jgi:RNase P/RNase MRP subunit POP5|nr:hypothetical protein [Candidatus Parvarchaeota archaeon]